VNLFFALSFLCAFIAPIHKYRMEQRLRKEGQAPPGEELSPLQKFMGRVDFSYHELGKESYEYALGELRKRLNSDRVKKKQDDSKTERTAAAGESQRSFNENNPVDHEANSDDQQDRSNHRHSDMMQATDKRGT
jgi:hypothetical protein